MSAILKTSKTAAKSITVKRMVAKPLPPTVGLVEQAEGVATAVEALATRLKDDLKTRAGDPFVQDDLIRARALKRLKSAAESGVKMFDDRAKEGGKFQGGPFIVTMDNKPVRRPDWKDEAIRLAALVAKLEGKTFVESTYVQAFIESTTATDTISVKILEAV